MRIKSLVACFALWPSLVSAAASEPVRIQPSSVWLLDYADDSCRLIREFGEGTTQAKLALVGVAPNEMTMLIVGGTLRAFLGGGEVKAGFLPVAGEKFIGQGGVTEDGKKGAAFWTSVPLTPLWKSTAKAGDRKPRFDPTVRKNIDPVERDAFRAGRIALARGTTGLLITPPSGRAMVLETGSLEKPIAMFDECERDLLRQWGVDPDVQDKLVKFVWSPNMLSWFGPNDYPQAELAKDQEAVVNSRLAVDASGKVIKCVSISAFDAPGFNKRVCDVYFARARFSPAELADGTKVTSYISETIIFRIPH